MNEVLHKIEQLGIVPVVKLERTEDALPLAKALIAGGLPCAEVTFRTPEALASIRGMAKAYPQMLLGAGTVLTTAQVDAAVEAGAQFIVSPGLNPKIVRYCVERGIPVTPGCANPSDVEQAIELGLRVVKFFPAEANGGLKAIRAMAAPYVGMRFMPTGGINPGNLNDYLAFDRIIACGGSWMVKEDLLAAGKFEEITALTRQAVDTMLGFAFAHIGVDTQNESQARMVAQTFAKPFGLAVSERPVSFFAGPALEIMKQAGTGPHGHIAFSTGNLDRAIFHLQARGCRFDERSLRRDEKGRSVLIQFQEQIGGFVLQLVQRS